MGFSRFLHGGGWHLLKVGFGRNGGGWWLGIGEELVGWVYCFDLAKYQVKI